jgi:hypothetical protein
MRLGFVMDGVWNRAIRKTSSIWLWYVRWCIFTLVI